MYSNKTIGWLIIAGAIGVLIPYSILGSLFNYPDILREDTAVILTKFHEGGSGLIFTWLAFAVAGLPLLPAYKLIGKKYEQRSALVTVATTIGIIGLVVQMIGLLRWVFVVPILSESFVSATDAATKAAAVMAFKAVHQFGGVLLGEHVGQLFTIVWTVLMSIAFVKMKIFPRWIGVLGIISSAIYLLAQADLFATAIHGFPVWNMAGFIGSTLWLLWLIIIGIGFLKQKRTN